MSELVSVVPEAIRLLNASLEQGDAEYTGQILRALQRLGLTRDDLIVHLERARVVNDMTKRDHSLEEALLLALDMVHGIAGELSLDWDSRAMAGLLLRDTLASEDLSTSINPALARNDMLPPRITELRTDELALELAEQARLLLTRASPEPIQAQFIRVPKTGFTSRPAALLAPLDRVCWEALGDMLAPRLEELAPTGVLWPRNREHRDFSDFVRLPVEWDARYVIRTDIESFYDSIDHTLLGLALTSIGASSKYSKTVESFLDVVMGSTLGLPQGPPASELFSSAFLLLIDRRLDAAGQLFARYADDYAFPADSMAEGRAIIEHFEALLREVGLRLHASKTKILRSSTYRANAGQSVSPRIEKFRKRLSAIARTKLLEMEDSEDIEARLLEIGVGEQTLFDLLYHRTLSMAEVVRRIEPLLDPTLTESYRTFFVEEADLYRQGRPPENRPSSQADLDEALLYLAGAKERIPNTALLATLEWNPSLAPSIAFYLNEVAKGRSLGVARFLRMWLTLRPDTDWVQSWGCYVAECNPELVDKGIADTLRTIADEPQNGPLARAGAVRALAAKGILTRHTWDVVYGSSSRPMQSEFFLDAISNPKAYQDIVDRSELTQLH